ncbi:MAG TPA: Asp23/Gls24 family envelope stress response protein [Symbiobacteriaceae bacterium]
MTKENDLLQGVDEQVEKSVRISDDVVGVIAGIAAMEVEGVAGMSGGFAAEMGERVLGKKNLSKGVKVQVGEKEAAIDLYIVVEYGVRIPDVATRVQENVKRAVESMTGLECVQINIHIQGVSFHSESREDDLRVR